MRLILAALLTTLACLGMNARTYLVAVGIADYSNFPTKIENLTLPASDAKAIAGLYADKTSVDYTQLLNGSATKDKILRAMEKVFGMAGPNDIVVFFFSGHGYPGGLCAADGIVNYKEIRTAIAKSKAKHKMMFIDACRAGGMRVEATSAQSDETAAKKSNVMLFLSSRNNENSMEMRTMKNGLFTTYLKRGLEGAADANRDKTVTAKELYNYVHAGVIEASGGEQHPVMWGKFSDNMPVMKY